MERPLAPPRLSPQRLVNLRLARGVASLLILAALGCDGDPPEPTSEPCPCDVALTKLPQTAFLQGEEAGWLVFASYSGGECETGVVCFEDELQPGQTLTGYTGAGWTCDVDATATYLQCCTDDPVGPGAWQSAVALEVQLAPGEGGELTNCATLLAGDGTVTNADPSNDEACASVTVEDDGCNCLDDDGDGLVDEGLSCSYPTTVVWTGDDQADYLVDGGAWLTDPAPWWQPEASVTWQFTAGTHAFAFHAYDLKQSRVGFLGAVDVPGVGWLNTGTGAWWVTQTDPTTDPSWTTSPPAQMPADAVTDASLVVANPVWGATTPGTLGQLGAQWVWYGGTSAAAAGWQPENWYVVSFDVCPQALGPVEICNGLDDDADGLVDEGYPDTDGDGVADCVDVETCDCLDNDGDVYVDEGLDCAYPIALTVNADDAFEAWLDGAAWGSHADWQETVTLTSQATAGTHAVAVHVEDVVSNYTGFLAAVAVHGAYDPALLTGAGGWRGTSQAPPSSPDWTLYGASTMVSDDLLVVTETSCLDAWGTYWPATLLGLGAQWVWAGDCAAPETVGENWYFANVQVCPEATPSGSDPTG